MVFVLLRREAQTFKWRNKKTNMLLTRWDFKLFNHRTSRSGEPYWQLKEHLQHLDLIRVPPNVGAKSICHFNAVQYSECHL